MPEPLLYLRAMAVAAIAGATFVLAMALSARVRRAGSAAWLNAACVAGLGFGFALGCQVLSLRWNWPAASALDRLLTIVVPAALIVELLAGWLREVSWLAWSLRLGLAAAVPRILLHGSVYLSDAPTSWPLWQAIIILTLCGALLAGVWSLLGWLARRSPGVSIPLGLCLATQCAGLTVMLAGYIKGGAVAFPWVAALAATSLGSILCAKLFQAPADIGIAATVGTGVIGLFGLLFIGCFFGRLTTSAALTTLLAPLLCWGTELPLLRRLNPWLVGAIRLALVAIPLVMVLAIAKRTFDRDMAPLLGTRPPLPALIHPADEPQTSHNPGPLHERRVRLLMAQNDFHRCGSLRIVEQFLQPFGQWWRKSWEPGRID